MRRREPGLRGRLARLALFGACAVAPGCSAEGRESVQPTLAQIDFSCPDSPLSPAPLRRLTRFEFANSVRDVFGADVPLAELFPRDEAALGFDDQAGTLSVTDLHVQGYLDSALSIADWLTSDAARLQSFAGCDATTAACARQLIATLGQRLERHPLSKAQLDGFLALFAGDFSATGFAEGASRAVAALLQAPEFVYRFERDPSADPSVRQASSAWTLASRLSFLFWGSGPDDALLQAAEQGALTTRADVEREARRLLSDARARRGVLHFYLQWLDLTDLSDVEKERRAFSFPWNDALRDSFAQETASFLEGVLWEDDARLSTLLTARYTYANPLLQDFYGLPIRDPDATEFTRVAFPQATARAGVLTQGSILATQAKANQTDPIHRGKFIRDHFLCDPPPPPPANLVVSPPLLDTSKTSRERFSQHRQDEACSICHEKLDPIGFLFEHYDGIGAYRTTENGKAIDASGYAAGSDISGPLDGAVELATRLAQSGQVNSCVILQWFRYTFGRGETEQDACTLSKLGSAFSQSHGDLAELLVAITQTDPFLYDVPAPAAEEQNP